jgi:hypothetical protein
MNFPSIEPLEARIAPATVSIANAANLTEGNSGKATMTFTVTLTGASTEKVTVNYATGAAGDTAVATGLFPDYDAVSGTLTFTPGGPTTKTIAVKIIGDQIQEADEQLTVKLSGAVNATLGTASGTGTILNGTDSKIGLALGDVKIVEGDSGTKQAVLTPTLSANATASMTLTLATKNGTAVAGSDYAATTQQITIAAGATTGGTISIPIGGDTDFESTESFFVNLSGAPSSVQVVNKNPLMAAGAQATARVYILNDDTQNLGPLSAQWIDVDGDLVTLTVSKGSVPVGNTSLFTFGAVNALGGKQLQLLDLQRFGSTFAGANVTITATKQAGFPDATDGRVDVGYIHAANFDADELQVFGIDLGTVTVDGDLAKITAGDQFSTPAITKLDVYSLGAHGATTLPTAEYSSTSAVESKVLGPVGSILVQQNIEGYFHVVGSEFGTIGSLKIGGALKGGDVQNSGRVSVSGFLSTATIGKITGGSKDSTGILSALQGSTAALGTITVLGDIVGGTGSSTTGFSGAIVAPRIGNVSAHSLLGGTLPRSGLISSESTLGNVTLTGDVTGSGGELSGAIDAGTNIGIVKIDGKVAGGSGASSGGIVANAGNIASVAIGQTGATDSLIGGSGDQSGRVVAGGNIPTFTAEGNVLGGTGKDSGEIVSGGTIDKLVIKKSLKGGAGGTTLLENSGVISASRLRSVTVGEDLVAATEGAGGSANGGAIRATFLDALTVGRNIVGNANNPFVISAARTIGKFEVVGNIAFGDVLAGYNARATKTNPRGEAVNADASIAAVIVGGTVHGFNLVAGAEAGDDGVFGTSDDVVSSSSTVTLDDPAVVSKIASVIFKSANPDNPAGATPFGIVAQQIDSILLGPTRVALALHKGPANDLAPGLGIGTSTTFRALEVNLI